MQPEDQLKSGGAGFPALLQAPETHTLKYNYTPDPNLYNHRIFCLICLLNTASPAVPAKAVELHFLAAACAAAGYLPEQGG